MFKFKPFITASLRFKLSLLYVLFLFLILSGFSSILYFRVAATLEKNIDQTLLLQAESLSDAVIDLWEARPSYFDSLSTFEKEQWTHQKLDGIFSRWRLENKVFEDIQSIRLLNPAGKTLLISRRFKNLNLSLTPEILNQNKKQITLYETFYHPTPVRLVSLPVVENQKVLYILQMATAMRREEQSLKSLRFALSLLIPLTLLVSFVLGWVFAGRALLPIRKMMQQIRRITALDLHQRLEVHKTGDELESLAKTVNQMLQRLEDAFKRQRQFSAAASHELRTPLTVMRGEIEVALRKPRNASEYRRTLKAHLNSIKTLSALVQQLLLLARSETSLLEKQKLRFDQLILESLQNFKLPIKTQRIKIVSDLAACTLFGEKKLLGALVNNLLDNALKHTPTRGEIHLFLLRRQNYWVFHVEDSGPGVPESEKGFVFDKFFKKPATVQGSYGIGLGLCRFIAEMHGGQIILAAPHFGQGATFEVFLPSK